MIRKLACGITGQDNTWRFPEKGLHPAILVISDIVISDIANCLFPNYCYC